MRKNSQIPHLKNSPILPIQKMVKLSSMRKNSQILVHAKHLCSHIWKQSHVRKNSQISRIEKNNQISLMRKNSQIPPLKK